jgi:DNA-binding response OmpR family regulator
MPSKIRLLYTDDDPDTREMMRFILEEAGYEVVCPETPQEFLRLARDERWDLFMLDSWMPGMSGIELCEKTRKFDQTTPIVFYSGAAFETDKRRALECGAFAYFIKPIPIEELVKGINSAVASRQPPAPPSH